MEDYPLREMPCWDCGSGVMSRCRNPEHVLCTRCKRERRRDADREKHALRQARRYSQKKPIAHHSQQDLGAIYALVVENPGITCKDLAQRSGLTQIGLEVALVTMGADKGLLLWEDDDGGLYSLEEEG